MSGGIQFVTIRKLTIFQLPSPQRIQSMYRGTVFYRSNRSSELKHKHWLRQMHMDTQLKSFFNVHVYIQLFSLVSVNTKRSVAKFTRPCHLPYTLRDTHCYHNSQSSCCADISQGMCQDQRTYSICVIGGQCYESLVFHNYNKKLIYEHP